MIFLPFRRVAQFATSVPPQPCLVDFHWRPVWYQGTLCLHVSISAISSPYASALASTAPISSPSSPSTSPSISPSLPSVPTSWASSIWELVGDDHILCVRLETRERLWALLESAVVIHVHSLRAGAARFMAAGGH